MNPAYLSRCDLSYLAALWIETETRSEMNRLPSAPFDHKYAWNLEHFGYVLYKDANSCK